MKKINQFKKLAAVLALAALITGSLAACGKDNGKTGDTGNTGNSTTNDSSTDDSKTPDTGDGSETGSTDPAFDPMAPYEEEVKYSLGRVTLQNPKLPEGDTYENNAYTRWVKETLNATCTDAFEASGDDYDRQVSLSIASEDIPDMMTVSKDILNELVENDLIADLSEVYDKYSSSEIKDIYNSYDGRCLNTATYDGKLMGLPATNVDSAPNMVWIRQDWLDKLGIKLDEDKNSCITLAELESTIQQFIDKDPGGSGNPVGLALAYTLNTNDYGGSTYCMTGIANAFGAYPKLWLKNDAGEVYNGSTTPEMKESLGLLADWFKKGLLDPQFGTRTWDDITGLLTNGQSGVTMGVWHIPDWLLSNVRAMDNNATFSAYVIEDGNGKAKVFHNNAAGSYVVVRKGFEHPELAVQIINMFYDIMPNSKNLAAEAPEVAEYQANGVDGSTRPFSIEINSYTSLLDDYQAIRDGVNGKIKPEEAPTLEAKNVIECALRYKEDPATTDVTDWSRYHSRMVGIELIDKLTVDGTFEWVEPVFWGTTETLKSNGANLDKLQEETFIKLITGELALDSFDQFVEDWKAQGGTQIISEIEAELQ